MKKNRETVPLCKVSFKLDLKMKLSLLFFITLLFQMSANEGYSQKTKISLNLNNASLLEVFEAIESKTDFNFFYKNEDIDTSKRISIIANNIRIRLILRNLFRDKNMYFKVINKQIVVYGQGQPIPVPKINIKVAQQLEVKGTVTDQNGLPMFGATVRVKDAPRGINTDIDGRYSIMVNKDDILQFSYVGFETFETAVNNRSIINVTLKEAVEEMEEVVLVGYGKVKKEAFTGSIGTIDVQSIANQGTILNIDQALQGQVSGVQVSSPAGRPGAAARVRIRGSSSILGTNQPLYVIDGVPITPSTETPGYSEFTNGLNLDERTGLENDGFNNDLGFIDFNNIESITILKDATATAIYGSRAAAGVVVITTKDGGKSKKPQFEFLVTQRANIIEKIDVLNTSQYEELYTEAITNYVNSGGTVPTTDSFGQGILNGTEINSDIDTDWQDLIGRGTSYTSNYSFNVRGAGEKGSYYSALSLQNDEGAIEGDKLTRYAFALNLRQNLKDNLSFFNNISIGRTENDFALTNFYSAQSAAILLRPDVSPYDEDGNLVARFGDIYNPLSAKERRLTSTNFSALVSIGLEYEPIKNLFIKSTAILQYIDGESYSFYPSYTQSGLSSNGEGNLVNRKTFNPTFETQLTYDFSVGNSNIGLLVGNTYLKENTETTSIYGENFPNDDSLRGISYAGEDIAIEEAVTKSALVSFFSRAMYDYDNRYLLSLAGRIDGSSKFGENNRWAFFPSAGIGWNIHREKFAENWAGLNFLKLRASIGQSGNITFDPNQSFSLFGAQGGTFGVYDGNTGVVPIRIGNPDLKWEITTQKDVGVEFAVLDNKIKGELGYYIKDTKDVLYQTELASTSGLASITANLGDTQNKGFELSLNFNILDNDNLKWNFGFNAATAKSKIIRLNTTYMDEFGGVSLSGLYLKEGEPIGLIKGSVANGLFESQEQIDQLNANAPDGLYQSSLTSPGDVYYADLDGDGEVTYNRNVTGPDVTTIGSIEPDFFGGINSNINYKGLSLNIFANYSLGNDIYWKAGENSYSYSSSVEQANKQLIAYDRWTPENTDAEYPRAVYRTDYTGGNFNQRQSSLYVKNADYLRIKTMTLGYNLPKEVLEKINFQGLYLYITGTNLFTITKYPGADPEFTNISSFRRPIDNNNYPTSKQLIAGFRLTF